MALADFDSYAGYKSSLAVNDTPLQAAFMRKYYRMLQAYYNNNGLYDIINTELEATRITNKDLKPIRNPAFRTVEFYASKLWPGTLPDALPIETENELIIDPIYQIWKWSNFASTKQRFVRWFANYGDMFIKIETKEATGDTPIQGENSVYLRLIEPQYVTVFELDERGFVIYIRLDIPQTRRLESGEDETFYHTEEWDKETQIWRIWQHDLGFDVALNEIDVEPETGTFMDSFGDDFVPFVYQPFRDDGQGRGSGAFSSQLDKIDEANRLATRLGQIVFRYNKALWAMSSNSMDATGRPLPPPSVSDALNTDGELELEDDTLIRLPGMSTLQPLVPNLNYSDMLLILQDQMSEIKNDLPELAYYDLRNMAQISGRAVRFMLDDAIARLLEARGNAEAALIRAHEMALTIGQNIGVFSGLGSFDDGAFDHTFAERSVLPLDDTELATSQKIKSETFQILITNGADRTAAAAAAGFDANDVEELAASGGRILAQDTDANTEAIDVLDANSDTPENIESDKGLNGAQIDKANSIAKDVTEGQQSPIVATELLLALGIKEERVKIMIDAAKSFVPKSIDNAA